MFGVYREISFLRFGLLVRSGLSNEKDVLEDVPFSPSCDSFFIWFFVEAFARTNSSGGSGAGLAPLPVKQGM